MPDQSADWVTAIEAIKVEPPPYRDILEGILEVQRTEPDAQVAYAKLRTELKYLKKLTIKEDELKSICQAMMRLVGQGYIYASETTVELSQKPEKVLQAIKSLELPSKKS